MMRSILLGAFLFTLPAVAQQPQQKAMGSVSTVDARVSGGLEVDGQRARLISNASVTALDRTAQIDLDRGGLVQVCSTSAFHLLRSGTADALLFALDRGAMELHTVARAQDAILTPDLRFTLVSAGPLDLRIRVTREGDTCVDNRGVVAPVLQIAEAFGDAQYRLAPGQHVLFEHGSLREVVDSERSNCGCPAPTPAMVAASSVNATSVLTPEQVAAQHPFPVAQSAGLAAVNPSVPIPETTVESALSFSSSPAVAAASPAPAAGTPAATQPAISAPAPPVAVSTAPPATPPGARDLAHRIGGFFHRLFHHKQT